MKVKQLIVFGWNPIFFCDLGDHASVLQVTTVRPYSEQLDEDKFYSFMFHTSMYNSEQ